MSKVGPYRNDYLNKDTAGAPTAAPDLLYSVMLYPHRSLDRRLYRRLGLGLIVLCFVAALRFIAVGAWPVVIFVSIDILALWFAFYLNYRRARLYETIQLSEKDLIVTRIHPNRRTESWRFDPYWCRIKLEKTDEGDSNRLVLTSHGEQLAIGSFLSPGERSGLARSLERAIAPLKGL